MITGLYNSRRMMYNNIMSYNDLYKVFKPKCKELGYCPEKRGCGKMKGRTDGK